MKRGQKGTKSLGFRRQKNVSSILSPAGGQRTFSIILFGNSFIPMMCESWRTLVDLSKERLLSHPKWLLLQARVFCWTTCTQCVLLHSSHYTTASQKCCIGLIASQPGTFFRVLLAGQAPHVPWCEPSWSNTACGEMGMLCRSYMSTWHVPVESGTR